MSLSILSATAATTAARVNMSTNKRYVYITPYWVNWTIRGLNSTQTRSRTIHFNRTCSGHSWDKTKSRTQNMSREKEKKKDWTQRQLQLKHTHMYLSSPQITIYINNNDCKQTPAVVKKPRGNGRAEMSKRARLWKRERGSERERRMKTVLEWVRTTARPKVW